MLTSRLALATGSDPNNIDHLIAIATGNAAMTFEASGVIGPAEAVLASGQYPGVQIRTAPLPALTTGAACPWATARCGSRRTPRRPSGPPPGSSFSTSTPRRSKHPWRPRAGTCPSGRPPRSSRPGDRWASDPNYRVGYTQLTTGTLSNSNIGSLIGDYQGVRNAVVDGLEQMVANGMSPSGRRLRRERGQHRHQDYNSRIGAG